MKIYLVGFSAGAVVATTAAVACPPGTVDQIILLASGHSQVFDLRPVLANCRLDIDTFHSRVDSLLWGLAEAFGPADGGPRPPAGVKGFVPIIQSPKDATLYQKLRQHGWDESWVLQGGHLGNHLCYARVTFLRAMVLPLIGSEK